MILKSIFEEFSVYLWKKECSLALNSESTLETSKELLECADKYGDALKGDL